MSYAKQVSKQTKKIRKQKFNVSETAFKFRYANHKETFNNIKYQTDTEISNEYWDIISANKSSNISWEILGTQKSYNQSYKRYFLCKTGNR